MAQTAESPEKPASLPLRLARGGLAICAALFCAITFAAYLERINWRFDLASHFRPLWALALLFCAVLAALLRSWRVFVAALFCSFWNFCAIAPYYLSVTPSLPAVAEPNTLRILQFNVLYSSRAYAPLLRYIKEKNPDVILLQELLPHWEAALKPLSEAYPYHAATYLTENTGNGIWSRYPLRDIQAEDMGAAGTRPIMATLTLGKRSYRIAVLHPHVPMSNAKLAAQRRELHAVAAYARSERLPLIVAGDFNATPWSRTLDLFERESGLQNSSKWHGVLPSYPVGSVLRRVPIDHLYLSVTPPFATLTGRERGAAIGSDHFPIITDLRLAP